MGEQEGAYATGPYATRALRYGKNIQHMPFKILLPLLLFLAGAGGPASAQVLPADSVPAAIPRMQWVPRQTDVGKVPWGVPVTRSFVVQNHGDSLLLITNVRTGCHCTTAIWTTAAIAPGDKGVVQVTFDALREAEFYKVIIVYTNQDVEQPMGLVFKGIVGEKPPEKDGVKE